MINFRNYRYNHYEEEHYIDIPKCIWCSSYIGNHVIRLNKTIEREGKEILVKYRLPYCSNKCYHDDPNGLNLMDQFIKDSEDWRKKYLKEEEIDRIKQKKENEEIDKRIREREKEELALKKKNMRKLIIFFSIFAIVMILGYLMKTGYIPEIPEPTNP